MTGTRACACDAKAPDDGACRTKRLQRQPAATNSRSVPVRAQAGPATRYESGGTALPASLRGSMESRFGRDFSGVRVHDDPASHAHAGRHAARAFTVGQHIHFAAGEYRPSRADGLRLLAHELAHTVQQRFAGPADAARGLHVDRADSAREREADHAADAVLTGRRPCIALGAGTHVLQRQGQPAETKTDVALVLAGDDISSAEGGALAPVVLRITSLTDLCKHVDGVGRPIGTMFVVSHASSDGTLRIEGASGISIELTMKDLAEALKKCKRKPDAVDFRGCKVGAAGGEVEKFRDVSGVAKARATNCPKFSSRSNPVTVDGLPATKPSQMPTSPQAIAEFDAAILAQARGVKADNGKSVAHCLVGLPSGQAPGPQNIVTLRKLYWANAGRFVASWASPVDNRDWQKESRCMKDLTTATSPCRLVEKIAPAPAKNKGAMLAPDASQQFAQATVVAPDEGLA